MKSGDTVLLKRGMAVNAEKTYFVNLKNKYGVIRCVYEENNTIELDLFPHNGAMYSNRYYKCRDISVKNISE